MLLGVFRFRLLYLNCQQSADAASNKNSPDGVCSLHADSAAVIHVQVSHFSYIIMIRIDALQQACFLLGNGQIEFVHRAGADGVENLQLI